MSCSELRADLWISDHKKRLSTFYETLSIFWPSVYPLLVGMARVRLFFTLSPGKRGGEDEEYPRARIFGVERMSTPG